MTRKRNERTRMVIISGGFGVPVGKDVTDGLLSLKSLLQLKKKGLAISGNVVSFCRLTCCASLCETIRNHAKEKKGILILQEEDAGEKQVKERFRKKKILTLKELTLATCSEELFYLIDLKPESFAIFSRKEETAMIER